MKDEINHLMFSFLSALPSTTTTTTRISPSSTVYPNDYRAELDAAKRALTQWRIVAIVVMIIGGFFILGTICLTGLAVILHSRNHRDKH